MIILFTRDAFSDKAEDAVKLLISFVNIVLYKGLKKRTDYSNATVIKPLCVYVPMN